MEHWDPILPFQVPLLSFRSIQRGYHHFWERQTANHETVHWRYHCLNKPHHSWRRRHLNLCQYTRQMVERVPTIKVMSSLARLCRYSEPKTSREYRNAYRFVTLPVLCCSC